MANETKEKKIYPKELLLKRNRKNLFRFTKHDAVPVSIYPGINRITKPEEIKLCMDHHAFDSLIESEAHELVTGTVEGKKGQTSVFTAMSIKACKKIITGTYSVGKLEEMLASEMSKQDREGVTTAVKDQIKMLKDPTAKDLVD